MVVESSVAKIGRAEAGFHALLPCCPFDALGRFVAPQIALDASAFGCFALLAFKECIAATCDARSAAGLDGVGFEFTGVAGHLLRTGTILAETIVGVDHSLEAGWILLQEIFSSLIV